MISLTNEQRAAVSHQGHVMVSACPGSGKTRAILAKLIQLTDDISGTPRSVACITYTNAAVDEIEDRLRRYASANAIEKINVSTIHSFCLQFIVRPYGWLIPEIPSQARVLTPEMPEFRRIVTAVEDQIGRRVTFRAFEDYANLSIDLSGEPIGAGYENGLVTYDSARIFWDTIRANGYIDFSMILYYAWRILDENSFVVRGLSSKFHSILVDEFQDTTDVQIDIFRKFHENNLLTYYLVGDENQSIYGFAGARPDLANRFAQEIGANTNLPFSGNFRSSSIIVDSAESLIARAPPMTAVGDNRDAGLAVEYVHANSAVEAITDYFLPLLVNNEIPLGNAAVLAPWWRHLVPIARRLREFDVPVFGPGARPYQRRRLFASLAEQLGACAEASHYLGLPGVEKSLFRLLAELNGETRFDVFSFVGRRTSLAFIYAAREVADSGVSGLNWLRQTAVRVAEILVAHGWSTADAVEQLPHSVEEMIVDMDNNGVDTANLQIADLGLFANPDAALKLITLHNSKGREFDAVAIVCMNDGILPHFTSRTPEAIAEDRRSLYVGMTRAKKLLMISSDRSDRRNPPSRFLYELGLAI